MTIYIFGESLSANMKFSFSIEFLLFSIRIAIEFTECFEWFLGSTKYFKLLIIIFKFLKENQDSNLFAE